MVSLTNVEIGSIVAGMIDNIPVGISGILTTIVDQQIYFAEQLTGNNIDTSSVGNEYQPGVINLAAANVMGLMESQGIGTKNVKIGELSITKGMQEGASNTLRLDGIEKLKAIGERMSIYQAWG